jgi:hypothetical protein
MNARRAILWMGVFAAGIAPGLLAAESSDSPNQLTKFFRSAGMDKQLDCTVRVSKTKENLLSIRDEGSYFFHYLVLTPKVAADAKIVRTGPIEFPLSCDRLVVVTHGWIDKGVHDWPEDTARQIARRTDPNEWICAFLDWEEGSTVINPEDAAKYARDIAGPRLAKAILSVSGRLKHIHLVGHSAGSWAVNSAAQILSEKTSAEIHLTFLDAFIPAFWKESELGKLSRPGWSDHYYTRDITFEVTQADLPHAHNIDITSADPWFKEHEFPWRWYYATIAGRFEHSSFEKNTPVLKYARDLEYGFARSLEAGQSNWDQSLRLPKANKAVKDLAESPRSKPNP